MAGQRDEDLTQNEDVQPHRRDTHTVNPPTAHIIQRRPQPASPISHTITITIEFVFSFLWSIVLGITQGFVNAFRRPPALIQDTQCRLISDNTTHGVAAVNTASEVPAVANVAPEAPAPVTNSRVHKWYVVIVGRKTGIFTSHFEAQSQIDRVGGNSWSKFHSREEAQAAWDAAVLRGDVRTVQDAAPPAAGLIAPPALVVPAPAVPAPVVLAPVAPAPAVPDPAPAPAPEPVAAAPTPAAAPATPLVPVAGPSFARLPGPASTTELVFDLTESDYDSDSSDEPSPIPVRFKRNSCTVHITGGR